MLNSSKEVDVDMLIIGTGNLCANLLPLLANSEKVTNLTLAGRSRDSVIRLANLTQFTAFNLGNRSNLSTAEIDLNEIEQTAETLSKIKPKIIFMGASLQAARLITLLPKEHFEEIDKAEFGLWLPMQLSLNLNLMKSVKMSGIDCKVVNSAFPDAVGTVLSKVGLAPDIGVGNIGNIVPALTHAAAMYLGLDLHRVEIKLIASHYFTHYVHRFGNAGRAKYDLKIFVDGALLSESVDHAAIFSLLNGPLRRTGGTEGQILTASSASKILNALTSSSHIKCHAPGPLGLPGGYPVLVSKDSIKLDLAASLTQSDAIKINEECQKADGIEKIDLDGTVHFCEREVSILKSILNYECKTMKLDDCFLWSNELAAKYKEYSQQFRF
ncbi:hypothetical protein [Erwinia oleae]|uniref:hypothetical protein n=1 Tax=Erwinia oleae TaxID=796334 RepID=UPI00068E6A59|nr:hypothetical protein [Erwinia oleae]